jgi:phosphoheptose isomerase
MGGNNSERVMSMLEVKTVFRPPHLKRRAISHWPTLSCLAAFLVFWQVCSANASLLPWERTIYGMSSSYLNASSYIADILTDGTAIIGAGGFGSSSYGQVQAYAPDGTLKWSYDTHGYPEIAVSADQATIYATSTNSPGSTGEADLYALQANGTFKWERTIYAMSSSYAGVSSYIGDILTDGTVIIGAGGFGSSSYGQVQAYAANGTPKWSYNTHGYPDIQVSADQATIYATSTNSTGSTGEVDLYALQANGTFKWERTIYAMSSSYADASSYIGDILTDGTVIIGAGGFGSSSYGQVQAYAADGTPKWSYDTHGYPDMQVSADQATIYATSTNSTGSVGEADLYAFSAGVTSCDTVDHLKIGDTSYNYVNIRDAFSDLSNGDTLKVQGITFTEDLNPIKDVSFTLLGGYSCDYSTDFGFTTVHGTLTISHGTATIGNLIMQ